MRIECEAQSVFAKVAALPFSEGVKRILDGFSYAIYPLEGSHLPAVTVLSTPHPLRPKASTAAAEQPSTVYPVQQGAVPPPPFAETYPPPMPDDASEPQLDTAMTPDPQETM